MVRTVLMMYVTLVPTILAGIFNMVWCKLKVLKFAARPIDGGRNFVDGRRIFGDSKSWNGLIGYILFNTLFMVLWGIVCAKGGFEDLDFFYISNANTLKFNLVVGVLLGLGYALFELPNSFLKRRLNIDQSKGISGAAKVLFIFLDQADSVFGVALVVWLFYELGIGLYILYVLIGAVTHILLNMMLYFMHLRKNMF